MLGTTPVTDIILDVDGCDDPVKLVELWINRAAEYGYIANLIGYPHTGLITNNRESLALVEIGNEYFILDLTPFFGVVQTVCARAAAPYELDWFDRLGF